MKRISLLGSTGSIGTQTLDIARRHGLCVTALSANCSVGLLERQAREFKPEIVCIGEEGYTSLKTSLADTDIRVVSGMDGLCEIASMDNSDIMLNSLVGMVGLLPTLTAIEKGRDIALANKETLVAGGKLVTESAKAKNVKIYPVDSEHSAIFQCLQGNRREDAHKIILTASGGPFFGKKTAELETVTVESALRHPNWSMGRKITIDSATLMNKGLEYIEAKWLFDIENIEIVVHRQSVIHSAVEYNDGSVIAQLGAPDMKIPIQYALFYPERSFCGVKRLSLTDYGTLTFEKPDYDTFICLKTCIDAIKRGGAYPCLANSANEEAVGLFLDGKIPFLRIGELVSGVLNAFPYTEINTYGDVVNADMAAREYVRATLS